MPKPPVRSVLVRIRAYPKELAGWKKLSRKNAMTLSTWARDRLNMAFDEPDVIEAVQVAKVAATGRAR